MEEGQPSRAELCERLQEYKSHGVWVTLAVMIPGILALIFLGVASALLEAPTMGGVASLCRRTCSAGFLGRDRNTEERR